MQKSNQFGPILAEVLSVLAIRPAYRLGVASTSHLNAESSELPGIRFRPECAFYCCARDRVARTKVRIRAATEG